MLRPLRQAEAVALEKFEELTFQPGIAEPFQLDQMLGTRNFHGRSVHRAGHDLPQEILDRVPVERLVVGLIEIREQAAVAAGFADA